MDPVLVSPAYRPPSGCGCYPHRITDSRHANLSNSSSYSQQQPPPTNANSQILHSILSMRKFPNQEIDSPCLVASSSPSAAAGAASNYNSYSKNSQHGQHVLVVAPDSNMALLGVPTPPPSEPGSPSINHMPRSPGGAASPSLSPHQYHHQHSHQHSYQSYPSARDHLPAESRVSSLSWPSSSPSPPTPGNYDKPQCSSASRGHSSTIRHDKMASPHPLIHISELSEYQLKALESQRCEEPQDQQGALNLKAGNTSNPNLKRKLSSCEEDYSSAADQPIDLSCPKKARCAFSEQSTFGSTKSDVNELCNNTNHVSLRKQMHDFSYNKQSASGASGSSRDTKSILKSILVGQLCSNSNLNRRDSEGTGRDDASQMHSLSSCHGLVRSPQERIAELMKRAKARFTAHARLNERNTQSASESSSAPSSGTSSPEIFSNSETVVQLAKKNLLPVSARISDWLVKIIQFAKSLPEFMSLPHNDQVVLIHNAWGRLLLLYMAETNFQFAVTPLGVTNSRPQPPKNGVSVTPPPMPEEPTVRTTEEIQNVIRKYQMIGVSTEEIAFLRLLILFNPSYMGIEIPAYIENVNSYVRHAFQEHCTQTATKNDKSARSGKLRYSQLLLTLPSVFGISPSVMESLFCRNVSTNTDIEVLLKEMLHKL